MGLGRGIHLGEARTLVDGPNLADGWPLGQPKGATLDEPGAQGPMAPLEIHSREARWPRGGK